MKPIKDAFFGPIDITNHCGRQCLYCTRCDRHLGDKRYHMSLEQFERALFSYSGFKGLIVIIGGEPLLHPQFTEICELIRKYYPPQKMHLFTSVDIEKSKYRDIIKQTFYHIAYNPHVEDEYSFHQPMTIAIKDVVKNEELRKALIDDCPLQRKWCPTITDMGAYFCEAGASIARLLGIKGWDVELGWWDRTPEQFGYQLDICQYCGMCIPMQTQHISNNKQKISPSFLKILQDNGLPTGDYELFDKEITVEEMKAIAPIWKPLLYKKELINETFQHSTIDWSKYA